MSCIRKAEVGICLVFWFKSKDVALVIGDEAQAGSEKSPASLDQEEISQDQGAKHLQSRFDKWGPPLCVPKSGPPTELPSVFF